MRQYHSFVLMQDGSLLAFGNNGSNRTGFIGNNDHLVSPQVVFSSGVQAVGVEMLTVFSLKPMVHSGVPDQINTAG